MWLSDEKDTWLAGWRGAQSVYSMNSEQVLGAGLQAMQSGRAVERGIRQRHGSKEGLQRLLALAGICPLP